MRRTAAATALAAALALAAPAHASGWAQWASPSDFVHAMKQWIAGLWEGGCIDPSGRPICPPHGVTPEPRERPVAQPGLEKEGSCIDPSGRPSPGCAAQNTAGSSGGH